MKTTNRLLAVMRPHLASSVHQPDVAAERLLREMEEGGLIVQEGQVWVLTTRGADFARGLF